MYDDRAAQLQALAEEIWHLDESPLYAYRRKMGYSPVVGEGSVNAAIMFIGEAPGREEAEAGRPFVGNAGKVLDELLASVGIAREDVYITNVVKDRPPGNRDPSAKEIQAYAPFLRQIEIIRPRVTSSRSVVLRWALSYSNSACRRRRRSAFCTGVLNAQTSYGAVPIVPLYYPAAAFYDARLRAVHGPGYGCPPYKGRLISFTRRSKYVEETPGSI